MNVRLSSSPVSQFLGNFPRSPIYFVLALAPVCLFAQSSKSGEGYIVTIQNDTVSGFVKKNLKPGKVLQFKASKGEKFTDYIVNDVLSFQQDGNLYVKLEMVTDNGLIESVFAQAIVIGEISLFLYDGTYYIRKNADPVIKLDKGANGLRHIGLLAALMNDCPEVQHEIHHVKLLSKDLGKLVYRYNFYREGAPAKEFIDENPLKINLKKGVRVGGNRNSLEYVNTAGFLHEGNLRSKFGVQAEIFAELSVKERFSVQPEVLFTQKKAVITKESVNLKVTDSAAYNLTYIQIPISIYYYFTKNKIRPYIFLGGIFGYAIRNNIDGNFPTRQHLADPSISTSSDEYGHRAGGGISINNNKRHRVNFEFSREVCLVNARMTGQKIHQTTIGLSTTITF